ncbi:MAG: response regulator transcription factor [Candidatus Acidiferrum sp.]
MTRVFIVAAPLRSRRELTALLDDAPDVEVVGTASSFAGAEEDWEELDVLLIRDSSESTHELFDSLEDSGLLRQPPVLLLLEQATQNKVNRAIQLGIRGVLPADVAAVQLISAVVAVAKGLVVLQPGELALAAASTRTRNGGAAELFEPLTPREKEVLQMLASGLGNKQIAAYLKISEHTAKFHVASILSKLGASSRTEAVSMGLRRGLILL